MSKVNLKLCPFCKGQADVSLRDMREYSNCFLCIVFCKDCGAMIKRQYTVSYGTKRTEKEAEKYIAKLWNRRDT